MPKIASLKLLRLAKKYAKAAKLAGDAELAFITQLKKEFPDCDDTNDGVAENLTYGSFADREQTRERLTEIIHGSY